MVYLSGLRFGFLWRVIHPRVEFIYTRVVVRSQVASGRHISSCFPLQMELASRNRPKPPKKQCLRLVRLSDNYANEVNKKRSNM